MTRDVYHDREHARVMDFLNRGYLMRVFHQDAACSFLLQNTDDKAPCRVPRKIAQELIDDGTVRLHEKGWHSDDWQLADTSSTKAA